MDNTGQACNSNKRMIVMEDIYDDFVADSTATPTGCVPGDPAAEADGTFAPLSSRAAAEGLAAQIQDAVDKGATAARRRRALDGPAAYLEPTVLTGVTQDMRAYQRGTLRPGGRGLQGPADEEALRWPTTPRTASAARCSPPTPSAPARSPHRLETGMANVNAAAGEGADMPFGGVKRSGFGRELGPLGMDEFVNKRLFYVAD